MSNKKHIDRVFQEKLKDFEVSPSSKVWQNIKGELEQSDDNRKVFPIWLRLAGVAATLLILLTIGNAIVSESGVSNNVKIVDTENTLNTPINQTNDLNNNNDVDELQKASQDEVLTNANPLDLNSVDGNNASKNTNVTTSETSKFDSNKLNNNDAVAESNTSDIDGVYEDRNTDYSTTSKTKKPYKNAVSQRNTVDASDQIPHAVAQNKTLLNSSEKANTSNKANANNNSDVSSAPTITEGVAQNNSEKQNNDSNTIPEFDKDRADDVMKNDTKDAVAENQSNSELIEKQEDTTTDEETEEDSPSIEEEIAKTEDIIEKGEEKVNRWQVYANVAPVYYNTLGKGSHIDDQFVQNSKSGEINMSYGVNVSYVLNDKLKLRSGLNSLDLSYDTDNVILYENVSNNSNSAPRNLDLTSTGQSFSAISATNLGAQQVGSGIGGNANAAISQRIAYYEVPLELEYNLVDNKFGVNVIGGFSTFILNDNAVFSEFEGFKTEIGEANNINDVSFSGNLGLGLDYKFSDKIKLNVQPTFKYQLNAYKNTSGNFRPYIVGVYTGLSYKF
jgi:hypothetical protein